MTQEEILEYNKRCALFLGWTYVKDGDSWIPPKTTFSQFYTFSSNLMYHSDWNWIHEVKKKIQELPNVFFHIRTGGLLFKHITVVEILKYTESKIKDNDFEYLEKKFYECDEKEAVVQAINQFLIWYNENKDRRTV